AIMAEPRNGDEIAPVPKPGGRARTLPVKSDLPEGVPDRVQVGYLDRSVFAPPGQPPAVLADMRTGTTLRLIRVQDHERLVGAKGRHRHSLTPIHELVTAAEGNG